MNVDQATKVLSEGSTLTNGKWTLYMSNGVLVQVINGDPIIGPSSVDDLKFVSKEEELGQMRLKLEG